MIHILGRAGRFLLTIKFGVVLMLCLMATMMFATQFEASFGTRAMKSYIYGSIGFDIGVALFVVNIVVNTLRRRPFRWRHAGFLTVHVGVLTIVTGGLMTRWLGIDGTMPIAEGETGREITLPENDLRVTVAGRTVLHPTEYDLLPARTEHDDLYDVPDSPYFLLVSRYFATGAVADTYVDGGEEENPVLRAALGAPGAEPAGGWLVARDPSLRSLRSGGSRVTFVDEEGLPGLRDLWNAEEKVSAGHLRLHWNDGATEVVHVPGVPEGPIALERDGYRMEVVEVFRSFTLTGDGHADVPGGPENPAIRFRVQGPSGPEEHFSFTAFPEFRMEPREGQTRELSHGAWAPSVEALTRGPGVGDVAVVREQPGRFVTWTSFGDPTDGTPLPMGETRTFRTGLLLRLIDSAERGLLTRTVARVSDEIVRPVVKVALVERDPGAVRLASVAQLFGGKSRVRPADVSPNEAWVFRGEGFEFPAPEGPIQVEYAGRSIPLDFGIHLEDFREETYPGISLAASYESHVVVRPDDGEEFRTRIYMNHPLIHAGYTFYQASFQRTPGGGEITVLSVARDPGMTVSFVGFCILVAGLLLIFFVKPWLRRLDARIDACRAAAGAAG